MYLFFQFQGTNFCSSACDWYICIFYLSSQSKYRLKIVTYLGRTVLIKARIYMQGHFFFFYYYVQIEF